MKKHKIVLLVGLFSYSLAQSSYDSYHHFPSNNSWQDKIANFFQRYEKEFVKAGLQIAVTLLTVYILNKLDLHTSFMGNNHFDVCEKDSITTRFDHVIGAQEAKDSLQDIINYLKNPEQYKKLNIRIPAGVILEGEPGNGKTLLARATAGEAGVSFISVKGSEFDEIFVGVGASRIRELFELAQRNAPCIIFIDEIDAIGGKRTQYNYHQTLNELLTQLDGFDNKKYPIVVMAATNSIETLDSALIRPGRFDRIISVLAPTLREREQILELYLKDKNHILTSEDIARMAHITVGASGAELENLVNQAAIMASKESKQIERKHFDQAADLLMFGDAKNLALSYQFLERIAYHESGHTLIALENEGILGSALHKVTIVPRGSALGATYNLPSEEGMLLMTQDQLLASIRILLGGYVAEELIFGQTSTGVVSDLQRASTLARQMVSFYGMNNEAGKVFYNLGLQQKSEQIYSEQTLQAIDNATKQIIEEQYQWVKAFLQEHISSLHVLAGKLLEEETLTDLEIKQALGLDLVTAEI